MAGASGCKRISNNELSSSSVASMDQTNHCTVMEAHSILLCDYVRLRKVGASKQIVKTTKPDKKLKRWKKGWVVVTIKELENCTVEFYKDEDHWLTPSKSVNKITVCEPLKDIVSVEHRRSYYKCHVMSIIFESFALLLSFKAQTTMASWIKKLDDIRQCGEFTEHYLVQLISSSNATIIPAPYILHVQSNKFTGYTALGTKEVAWVWNTGDFFAYRLKKKIVPEVEIIIGTESSAHGNFQFIGPSLHRLCKSIMEIVVAKSSDKTIQCCTKGDCQEETWGDMPSRKSYSKSSVKEHLLQPNPSYGVRLESPCPVRKSITDETDQVVYDNDQILDSDDPEDYVNDQPGAFEEYEYIDVQSSPRSSPKLSESNEYY